MNGPSESKNANIGISLPGTGKIPVASVYVDGQKTVTLRGERIAGDLQRIVEDDVHTRYGKGPARAEGECGRVADGNSADVLTPLNLIVCARLRA